MKKVYLTGAVFALSSLVFGQINQVSQQFKHLTQQNTSDNFRPAASNNDRAGGDIITTNDFSDPSEWTVAADANGYAWTIGTTTPADVVQYWGAMASTSAANGFATFNGITTLLTGTYQAQNASVELNQSIDCSTIPGVILEFEQRYRAFNSDQTIVQVSGDGGVTYTDFEVNSSVVTNAAAVQNTVSINISAVAANQANVKVKFLWIGEETPAGGNFGCGYGWMVDDFQLTEAFDYESALEDTYYRMGVGGTIAGGLEYHLIPLSQASPIEYSGKIKNNGSVIQTGTKLSVDILSGASTPYSESSNTIDLALLATDSLVVTPSFTPSAIGTYDVTITASQTNTENNTLDNVQTHSFEVTEATFGRDNGTEQGGISNVTNNDGNQFSIGNLMNIFADGIIGALDIKLTSDAGNVDKKIYGAVYVLNSAQDGYDQIGQTNDYTVQAGDNNGFVKLFFPDFINVSAGQEILIAVGSYTGEVEFASAQGADQGTVLGYADGSLFNLTGASVIMVRADMNDYTNINESDLSNISVSQNVPNPFNGETLISYNLNEASNVSLTIMDVTGKVISTINEGAQAAGTHNISVDGASLAAGTYFYTLTAGTYQVTKRMVVSK